MDCTVAKSQTQLSDFQFTSLPFMMFGVTAPLIRFIISPKSELETVPSCTAHVSNEPLCILNFETVPDLGVCTEGLKFAKVGSTGENIRKTQSRKILQSIILFF